MGDPDGARPPRRARSARRQFAATMLTLEAFVVLFAALVAYGLQVAEPARVWLVGGALVLSLLLAAGTLGRPGGYVVGTVLQLAVVAAGLAVPMMYVVGGVFAALWVASLRLGARIDRERAERERAAGREPADQGPDGR
ncbi:DUF4233 domain-containing protein [Actinotalea fermentans]|uniref:DUF4233 domain-containing protein n=1 Tax=Actinotalea fermentans TaxID=43671 RepID=A0A511YVY8_9CELL|nr:DUF4233 domain-containing protein [Actinotalea fermentans]KGM16001.1 hypothetical protein N867_03865 [Actinotalea fermentans ATCC 43279 = JCM 9966 = DSM 3133]GEN79368.1 hypothetical protein AFE02nite_11020 [Actinotalea fermentans]